MTIPTWGETWMYVYNRGCTLQHAHTTFANEDILQHITPHLIYPHSSPYLLIPITIHDNTQIHNITVHWQTQ
eukprot:1344762-Prorocentrum_lima.AAC.1